MKHQIVNDYRQSLKWVRGIPDAALVGCSLGDAASVGCSLGDALCAELCCDNADEVIIISVIRGTHVSIWDSNAENFTSLKLITQC